MKFVIFIILLYLLLATQGISYHIFYPVTGVWPDLAFVLVIFCGLKWGRIKGAQVGAFAGFAEDLLSFGSPGFNFLGKSISGFLAGFLRERFVNDSYVTRIAMVAGGTLLDLGIYGLISSSFLEENHFVEIISKSAPLVFLNTASMFVLFPLFNWLDKISSPASSDRKYIHNPYAG